MLNTSNVILNGLNIDGLYFEDQHENHHKI